ncbi:MAG: prolipoprotein diacylglyceryl transferase [Dehalococcoidia bacterium]|nr:prolipoprotein diacylglyceryl transferase [Dehalococcoidia bacterium]
MINIGINPVIFSIGPFTLRWYGVFMGLAIIFAVWWTTKYSKKMGIPEDIVYGSAAWAIPVGLIVARLFHVIDQIDYYILRPRAIFGFEGLAVFGGVVGAAIGIFIYSRIKHFPFGPFVDMIAPGAILAQAIGRLACTVNGCSYGTPTTVPWAFIYTHPNTMAPLGVPTHPTVIYEILWDLVVFGLLWKLKGRLNPPGSIFVIYLAAYSVGRFFLTFLRQNDVFAAGLLEAQLVSLITLAAALPFLIIRTRWIKRTMDEAVPED